MWSMNPLPYSNAGNPPEFKPPCPSSPKPSRVPLCAALTLKRHWSSYKVTLSVRRLYEQPGGDGRRKGGLTFTQPRSCRQREAGRAEEQADRPTELRAGQPGRQPSARLLQVPPGLLRHGLRLRLRGERHARGVRRAVPRARLQLLRLQPILEWGLPLHALPRRQAAAACRREQRQLQRVHRRTPGASNQLSRLLARWQFPAVAKDVHSFFFFFCK